MSKKISKAGCAAYLLFGRNRLAKFSAVLWLSSNFLFYRLGNYLADNSACPCLGTVFNQLGFDDPDAVNFLLSAIVLYLWCGSLFCLRQEIQTLKYSGVMGSPRVDAEATP